MPASKSKFLQWQRDDFWVCPDTQRTVVICKDIINELWHAKIKARGQAYWLEFTEPRQIKFKPGLRLSTSSRNGYLLVASFDHALCEVTICEAGMHRIWPSLYAYISQFHGKTVWVRLWVQ